MEPADEDEEYNPLEDHSSIIASIMKKFYNLTLNSILDYTLATKDKDVAKVLKTLNKDNIPKPLLFHRLTADEKLCSSIVEYYKP